jgi:hypothetical protein
MNIDSQENIKDSKVWVYGGLLDDVIPLPMQDKLVEQYKRNGAEVLYINYVESEHTFPTDLDRNHNECSSMVTPFINNCGFDAVGSILSHIFPMLKNDRDLDW